MAATIVLFLSLIAFQAQAGPVLRVGEAVQAVLGDNAVAVHTPALDARPELQNPIAVPWALSVETDGVYYVDLHSYDFDSYLILQDQDGLVLAEDDNGIFLAHSRLRVELQADSSYRLLVCSLTGGRGDYQLQMRSGEPPTLSPAEMSAAKESDILAAIEHWRTKYGEANDGYIHQLQSLGAHYYSQGHADKAVPYFEQALAICIEIHGEEHVATAEKLNNLAVILQSLGRMEESRPLYEKALQLSRKAYGSDHLQTAGGLNNLAFVLEAQGNYSQALPMFLEALAIYQRIVGADHPNTINILNNIAGLQQKTGNYKEARRLFEKQLSTLERIVGPEHASFGIASNNLAVVLDGLGELEAARVEYERSIQIFTKLAGLQHPKTLNAKANLGLLLHKQGKQEDSLNLLTEVLEIRQRTLGADHPDVAQSFNLLGGVLLAQGRYKEAEPANLAALEIRKKVFGEFHPLSANSMHALSLLSQEQGHWAAALEWQEKVLSVRKKVLGATHPDTAISLHNFAQIHQALGDMKQARLLFEQSVRALENGLGEENPITTEALSHMASLLAATGEQDQAIQLWKTALRRSLHNIDREMTTMSEAGRFQLLAQSITPQLLLAEICKQENSDLIENSDLTEVYGLFLDWKGKATRLQEAGLRLRPRVRDDESVEIIGGLQVLSRQLTQLVHQPLEDQQADHGDRIATLKEDRLELERLLNRKLGLPELLAQSDSAMVQDQLPNDAALVDLYVGLDVYAWIVLKSKPPQLLCLGTADELQFLQSEFLERTALRGGRQVGDADADPAAAFRKMLWDPIAKEIGTVKRVLISADGFLGKLPFGILTSVEKRYLLEDYQFHYLADATQLLKKRAAQSEGSAGPILAVGGVNYFKRAAFSGDVPEPSAFSRSRMGTSWSTLAATREELSFMSDMHQFVLEWQSPMLTLQGAEATEEAVRAQLPGRRYVHLATHGYFEPEDLPSLQLNAVKQQQSSTLVEQKRAVGLLPGLLSGLVFAGVNGDPDPTRDDGYLSAEEIQHLDLSACDLVVLSACETALGSARAGEGLMSLRRAFSVAGADTVISSLWKVDDVATAQLMKDFYTNLWEKGMSRGEALHEAKLRMLRRSRIENGGAAMPSTWGAFVLSGEWN
ncbi:MAG: CHAT domain-containing protein [Planctomycetes bacterium]|nr:CHAT domain-containing protein [Planctomycetota bacterium]